MGKSSSAKKNVTGQAARIEVRQAQVAELYTKGWAQTKIAKHLGVSQTIVHFDLKALRAAWTEQAMWDMTTAIGLQLAKLDQVEEAAWGAWKRSIKGPTIKRHEDGTEEQFDIDSLPDLFEGNYEWLDLVRKCVADRCKILGVTDKPANNTNNTNNLIVGADFWDRVSNAPNPTDAVERVIAAEERLADAPSSAPTPLPPPSPRTTGPAPKQKPRVVPTTTGG